MAPADLSARYSDLAQAIAKPVAEGEQLATIEWHEHSRKRIDRELSEKPRQHARIKPGILAQGQRKVSLGRIARAIKEEKVDQIAWLGPG
jgi:hypothetical protein